MVRKARHLHQRSVIHRVWVRQEGLKELVTGIRGSTCSIAWSRNGTQKGCAIDLTRCDNRLRGMLVP